MAAPLILAGLSLLPKIPEIWSTVAGLFGKKVPDSIETAANLANDVFSAFKKDEVSPEVQVKLDQLMNQHKEKIAEIALEEKRIEYDLMKGSQEVEKEAYKSTDQFVRRTRPKILRDLFKLCAGYTLFAPLTIVALSYTDMDAATMMTVVNLFKYIGYSIFGAFTLNYGGYTAGRTIEKKNGVTDGSISHGLVSTISALIKK